MAFLTVAGITLEVQLAGAARLENIYVGSKSRAFAGNLRSSIRAEKRAWQFTTPPMATADVATLRTAIANGAFVTVGGTLIGADTLCTVVIASEELLPTVSPTTYQSVLALKIEEA
jgi:hypothetical protein